MNLRKNPEVTSAAILAKFVSDPVYLTIIRNVCKHEKIIGADADDIVQEVSLRALRELNRRKPIRNIFHFAKASAKGLLFNHRRTKSRRNDHETNFAHLRSFDLRPCDPLEESEECLHAALAIAALTPHQQTILAPLRVLSFLGMFSLVA